MRPEVKKLQEVLRNHSLRFTKQREGIAEEVFSMHTHFTADELYAKLRGRSQISRATVYRTLNLMEEARLIKQYDFGKGRRFFEHILGHEPHNHLVCLECGKIEEFKSVETETVLSGIAHSKKFALRGYVLHGFGLCKNCQKN